MFVLEYIKNPKSVGAVAPSSKFLADKMINTINFEKAKCIVEYGPGTGAFTEKILARAKDYTVVLLVEINREFYKSLRSMYSHKKNVIIVNDSAENIDNILKEYSIKNIDYVVSGLPFTSLPKNVSRCILEKTSKIISGNAEFITFQYSLFKLDFFRNHFNKVNYNKVIRNLPPAYVLNCKGGRNE